MTNMYAGVLIFCCKKCLFIYLLHLICIEHLPQQHQKKMVDLCVRGVDCFITDSLAHSENAEEYTVPPLHSFCAVV